MNERTHVGRRRAGEAASRLRAGVRRRLLPYAGALVVILVAGACQRTDGSTDSAVIGPPPAPVYARDGADPGTAVPAPVVASAPLPAATASPAAKPGPDLHRLTDGGCCTQPFWSADSRQVRFIDRPPAAGPAGIWGVDVAAPAGEPRLVTERIGTYTRGMDYRVETAGDVTTIERLADGQRWTVPARGRPVSLSPGRKRIGWDVTNRDLPFERQVSQLWVANLDGSEARALANVARGSLAGWVDDDTLLISGRESLGAREQRLYTLSLVTGATVEVARSERLRGGLISPDGQWLVYYVALDTDSSKNGLWLARTDGSERRQLDHGLFGAYQWRDPQRLLIIPFRPVAESHELWELDVATGEARRLTDPATLPFKVANGDWIVSPDGRYVAFVASQDDNIWLIDLGSTPE
jgi:Tol biopolymer transport system component